MFTTEELKEKFADIKKRLHSKTLKLNMEQRIIPRLKSLPLFATVKHHIDNGYKYKPKKGDKINAVQCIMRKHAMEEDFSTVRLFAPIEECVDWKTIHQLVADANTSPNDLTVWSWGLACFAAAACIVLTKTNPAERVRLWQELVNLHPIPKVDQIRLMDDFGAAQRQNLSRHRTSPLDEDHSGYFAALPDFPRETEPRVPRAVHEAAAQSSSAIKAKLKMKRGRRVRDEDLTDDELPAQSPALPPLASVF